MTTRPSTCPRGVFVLLIGNLLLACPVRAARPPTAFEQYAGELVNRARANPTAEMARQGVADINSGVTSPPYGPLTTDPKQPLAFNANLTQAASDYSRTLLDNNSFEHTYNGTTPQSRAEAAGYVFSPSPFGIAENLSVFTSSNPPPYPIDAAFCEASQTGWFQSGGHRYNMMLDFMREFGTGIQIGGPYTLGSTHPSAAMHCHEFSVVSSDPFLTGVVFTDSTGGDNFYTPGEGLSGITITATPTGGGSALTTTTWAAGGYTLQVPNGTYVVTASGAGLPGTITLTSTLVINNLNVKRDVMVKPVNMAENTTAVATLAGTDLGPGTNRNFSIVGGADQSKFNLISTSGVLAFNSAPNFEAPTDSGANNVYEVIVRVTNIDYSTMSALQVVNVTVTNANDAPVISSNGGGSSASVSIPENSTAVTTVTATDVDPGTTFSYSISGGADAAFFTIHPSTGALSFVSAPNFENKLDGGANNIYDVIVQVTDSGSPALSDTQSIAVTVTNVNEPPVITSNGGGDTASVSAAENQTAVTTVTSTEPDAAQSRTCSIVGGADSGKFSITSGGGVLTFAPAPDFETPSDANADGVYEVTVRVTDNGSPAMFDSQTLSITVTNANDTPTDITLTSTSIAENNAANATVGTLGAVDQDAGQTFTFALVSGTGSTDNASFNISGTALRITGSANFETKSSYSIRLRATDNGSPVRTFDKVFAITVSDVNEAPTITSNGGGSSAAISVTENSAAVTTVTATDPDSGQSRIFSILGGADQARFTIHASTGQLTFVSTPDFENPTDADGNNIYLVTVQAADNGTPSLTDTQDIGVTVTNVTEAPLVVTQNATSISSTGAVLNASISPSGAATTAKFQHGTSAAYGTDVTITLSPNNGNAPQAVNAAIAGLAPATQYHFRATATNSVGTTNGGDLVFTTLSSVEDWRQQHFGSPSNSGAGADTNDFDRDGLLNLAEFAFGLDPKSGASSQLPQAQLSGGNLVVQFTEPAGVSGITYAAESSSSLLASSWQPVADTGIAPQHIFSVPTTGNAKAFIRLVIVRP